MTVKIVVSDIPAFEERHYDLLRREVPTVTVATPSNEDLATELADAEVFFGYHEPQVFREATKLKWIQTSSAGLDAILIPEVVERNLLVSNASAVHAAAVVEQAWALTTAISRDMSTYFRQQIEHVWEWGRLYDLDGATAGIIGLGGIGRRYAKIAEAFGMRVIAVDAHQPGQPEWVSELWSIDRLDDLLAESDVVLVACPYTAETHHLINADRLAAMKADAILINIARGSIVDEAALAKTLQEGHLMGAGIDVCEEEPLPAESPLWDVPRLIITPHVAGHTSKRKQRLMEFFIKNLRRYLRGEAVENLVDQRKGYPIPTAN